MYIGPGEGGSSTLTALLAQGMVKLALPYACPGCICSASFSFKIWILDEASLIGRLSRPIVS